MSITWDTPFEVEPVLDAPLSDIVDFVEEMELELWNIDKGKGPSKAQLRRAVEWYGYKPWNRIVHELRRRRILAGKAVGDFSFSDAGIEVRHEVIEAALDGLEPMCPFRFRFVETERFQRFGFERPCGTWCCRDCGPTNAEELLAQVKRCIGDLEEVFSAEVASDPKLFSRLSTRRKDHGIEMFWYRTVEGRVYIIADKPFPGSAPPQECMPMAPERAIEWIQASMWVPGHDDHGWSNGWRQLVNDPKGSVGPDLDDDTAEEGASDAPDSGADDPAETVPRLIAVSELSELQVERVLAKLKHEAQERYGIRIETGHIPADVRPDLVRLLTDLIEAEKESGQASRSQPRNDKN